MSHQKAEEVRGGARGHCYVPVCYVLCACVLYVPVCYVPVCCVCYVPVCYVPVCYVPTLPGIILTNKLKVGQSDSQDLNCATYLV